MLSHNIGILTADGQQHNMVTPTSDVVNNPNGISTGSAVFAQIMQRVPILYNGQPLSPSKLPYGMGESGPHLIHGSLGLPESTTQMASQSVQHFVGTLLQ